MFRKYFSTDLGSREDDIYRKFSERVVESAIFN
jgi:hypothetical protein